MLSKLVALVLTGVASIGIGSHVPDFMGDLTDSQKQELISAKEAAVEVLSQEEKDFIASLEGKEMRDLTFEEKTKVREIKEKIGAATYEKINDEKLKATLKQHQEEREARRAERRGRHFGGRNGCGIYSN